MGYQQPDHHGYRDKIVMPKRFDPQAHLENKNRERAIQEAAMDNVGEPLNVPASTRRQLSVVDEERAEAPQKPPRRRMSARTDENVIPEPPPIHRLPTRAKKHLQKAGQQPILSELEIVLARRRAAEHGPPVLPDKGDSLSTRTPRNFVLTGQGADQADIPGAHDVVADVQPDRFCMSNLVSGLNAGNYWSFLMEKSVAMVMFYEPHKPSCAAGKTFFVKAAETTQRSNAAFAAVDCTLDSILCGKEGVTIFPSYKLFSRGHLINKVGEYHNFDDVAMRNFMENAPVLTQDGVVRGSCRNIISWFEIAASGRRP